MLLVEEHNFEEQYTTKTILQYSLRTKRYSLIKCSFTIQRKNDKEFLDQMMSFNTYC